MSGTPFLVVVLFLYPEMQAPPAPAEQAESGQSCKGWVCAQIVPKLPSGPVGSAERSSGVFGSVVKWLKTVEDG